MPFAARGGFLHQFVVPTPAPTEWYDLTASDVETEISSWSSSSPATLVNANDTSVIGSQSTNNYLCSVLHPNGNIYLIPSHTSSGVLEYDPVNLTSSTLTFGLDWSVTGTGASTYKYISAVLHPNGNIYCIPYSATNIAEIDVANNTGSFHTWGGSFSGLYKYYGSAVGPDNKIYCPPFTKSDVLIIDPANASVEQQTYGLSFTGTYKYIGIARAFNDKLYCATYQETQVLELDVTANVATKTNYGQSTYFTSGSDYQGATVAKNGNVYLARHNESGPAVIDPSANTVIQPSSTNRSVGAVLGADGNVYLGPWNASNATKIDVTTDTVSYLSTGTRFRSSGTAHPNGNVYLTPRDGGFTIINTNGTGTSSNINYYLTPWINHGGF